jgi:hypothetical protein
MLAQKTAGNREEARALYVRIDDIQESLVRAVPDVTVLSPTYARAIEAFDA